MVKIIRVPRTKLTIDSTVYEGEVTGNVIRVENGVDQATFTISDFKSEKYPSLIKAGKTVKFEIKNHDDSDYTTIFQGVIRFVHVVMGSEGEWILRLKCLGAAYGLPLTVCAEEYGAQSLNSSLDTITKILTDSNKGVIPKWVNKIMGGTTNSGYSYTTTFVDTITNSVPYVNFPYKPCNKVLDDLCDLVTAKQAGNAGAHWIVTPQWDLHVKLLSSDQTGWSRYYGGSQANATIAEGELLLSYDFEDTDVEANYILYYGILRKPAQDSWTEADNQQWYLDNWYSDNITLSFGTQKVVGNYSMWFNKALTSLGTASYPKNRNAGWNLQNLGSMKTPPLIRFYAYESAAFTNFYLRLETTPNTDYFQHDIQPDFPGTNQWMSFSYPVGPYYRNNLKADKLFTWTTVGSPSWSNINCISFAIAGSGYGFIDDLHFEGLICRAAYNSTNISANGLKVKIITDNVGKDDSMKATDDSGTIAQLAYAELLRSQTSPLVGQLITPMIYDLLPGQLLHIHAKKQNGNFTIDKDMRVTKIEHNMSANGYTSLIHVTDDLTNAHPRLTYDDLNRILAAVRPEYQDRQATNIKAGELDREVPRLEKDYA